MKASERVQVLVRDEQGLSTVEYVVLLVLIVGLSVGLWNKFGNDVKAKLEGAQRSYSTQVSQSGDED